MTSFSPSFVIAPSKVASAFEEICSLGGLESFEQLARNNSLHQSSLSALQEWQTFSSDVHAIFALKDWVVLKGLPVDREGVTLLLASQTVASGFRTYRGGQIIKHFKMSPWTAELSHTTREGEFHTDLNTEPSPPAITAMQCFVADPGAPTYGLNRVARLADLCGYLKKHDSATLDFLTKQTVTMLNDYASSSWSGNVIRGNMIRYHPETLRAAVKRVGRVEPEIEAAIAGVCRAALAISDPFNLDSGDVLLLSNHRTLHYRGECSVVFKRYPVDFDSRSIFVLHMSEERRHE